MLVIAILALLAGIWVGRWIGRRESLLRLGDYEYRERRRRIKL
jgi:uncharacterized protein YneF (UPF0154 family)